MTVYIYALCDPDTKEPRYVGLTSNLTQRFWQHIKRKDGGKKHEWLDEIGQLPYMVILEVVSEKECLGAESQWIKTLHDMGAALTNGINTASFLMAYPEYPPRNYEYMQQRLRGVWQDHYRRRLEAEFRVIELYIEDMNNRRTSQLPNWGSWFSKQEVYAHD